MTEDHLHPAGESPTSGPAEGLWKVPWGALDTVLGVLFLLLAVVLALDLALLAGLGPESAAGRLILLCLQCGVFVLVPAFLASSRGARPADLGVRPASARAVVLGALRAPVMIGIVMAYHLVLALAAPSLLTTLGEEAQAQAEVFAAPLPLLLLLAVVVAPLSEEFLFRGFVYGGLRTRLGPVPAAAISSLFFSAAHEMPVSAPILFLLGLWLARVYEKERSLAVPFALHGSFNLLVLALRGFAS